MSVNFDSKYNAVSNLQFTAVTPNGDQEIVRTGNNLDALMKSTAADYDMPEEVLSAHVRTIRELINENSISDVHVSTLGREQEKMTCMLITLERSLAEALSMKPKYEEAQTKFNELTEQLTKQQEALNMAKKAKEEADLAFQDATEKRKNPQLGSASKTRLNKKWPEIQSTKTKNDVAYNAALRDYEASQKAVEAQAVRLKGLADLLGSKPEEIEQEIQWVTALKESSIENRAKASAKSQQLSNRVTEHIKGVIEAYGVDDAGKQKLKEALFRLIK